MIIIYETWEKGKLVSRTETDDGIPSLEELDARLKLEEAKAVRG
jgi:hypothetical protein